MAIIKKARPSLATVGVKILVGVTLASNVFIGALLYVHLQSSATVAEIFRIDPKVAIIFAVKEAFQNANANNNL